MKCRVCDETLAQRQLHAALQRARALNGATGTSEPTRSRQCASPCAGQKQIVFFFFFFFLLASPLPLTRRQQSHTALQRACALTRSAGSSAPTRSRVRRGALARRRRKKSLSHPTAPPTHTCLASGLAIRRSPSGSLMLSCGGRERSRRRQARRKPRRQACVAVRWSKDFLSSLTPPHQCSASSRLSQMSRARRDARRTKLPRCAVTGALAPWVDRARWRRHAVVHSVRRRALVKDYFFSTYILLISFCCQDDIDIKRVPT